MIHKCCCCIPLRAGVIIIATLSLLAEIASIVYLALQRQAFEQYYSSTISNFAAFFYASIAVAAVGLLAALMGLIGATTQKRGLVNIFKIFYWIMAILTLIVTVAAWIFLLVKRDDISMYCSEYLERVSSASDIGGVVGSSDACDTSVKSILIGGAIGVVIGNFLSIYFACVISSYSSRLKRSNQHHPLRDLEDFPQTSYKTSVY